MRFLSGKEKKELKIKLPQGYEVDKKDEITQEGNLLFKDKEAFLIIKEDKYLPHLKSLPQDSYKSVYIDHGALPFLLKGADMMRPGITFIDEEIESGDIVTIKDEVHKKTLALGFALLSSSNMKAQEKGKSVEVYHYFKDSYF